MSGGIEPQHAQDAATQGADARDHAHGRGLPGAVRAEEAEGLASSDGELDPVDGHEVAEALDQAVGLDHGLALLVAGGARLTGVVRLRTGDACHRRGM